MTEDILRLLTNGAWMHAGAKDVPGVSELLMKSADICFEINSLRPTMVEERRRLFRNLLGSVGDNFIIHSPFRCDFGFNVHIGKNFVGNFNMTILDEAKVTIGDNVMIGPNVTIATPMHPMLPEERNCRLREDGTLYNLEYAKPVTIENDCWLAANVVVCGGVTIGEGSVIGAGSVVTKNIPPHSLAVGNPCRVIREITEKDRME